MLWNVKGLMVNTGTVFDKLSKKYKFDCKWQVAYCSPLKSQADEAVESEHTFKPVEEFCMYKNWNYYTIV